MAMPRYLYSINDSMRDPLLVKPENIEDDEVETLAMSPEHSPIPEEDSDRFEQDVVLSPTASEARHSDLYISARLAAAGIPAPTEARDKDNLISGAFSLTFAHNAPESGAGEVSHRQYGTYEYNYNEGVSAGKNYTHLISTGSTGGEVVVVVFEVVTLINCVCVVFDQVMTLLVLGTRMTRKEPNMR